MKHTFSSFTVALFKTKALSQWWVLRKIPPFNLTNKKKRRVKCQSKNLTHECLQSAKPLEGLNKCVSVSGESCACAARRLGTSGKAGYSGLVILPD